MLCGDNIGHFLAIDGADDIARLEALVDKQLVVVVSEFGILERQIVLAPMCKDTGVDEQCRQEVDQHAAADDAKALPGFFAAVFPGLRFAFEFVFALGFVDHSCYVAIAAQGYPADTPQGVVLVFGRQVLFVPLVGSSRIEEEEMPFAIEFLGFKYRKTPIEEKVETAYSRLEEPGKTEMPEFVCQYEERKAEDQCYYFH